MTYINSRGVVMSESAAEEARVVGTSAGNETINAPAGNSSLSGETGGDTLIGNNLDQRFWITDPHDVVIEQPGGGIDTEIGWTSIKLAPNVENLEVHGDFNYAWGNDLDNLIKVDGRQWVYGGKGDDVLVGSTATTTTYLIKAGEGSDVIYNWNAGSQVQLLNYNFKTFSDIQSAATQQGADTVIKLSATETVTLRDTTVASLQAKQFLLPLDTSKLGAVTFQDDFNSLQTYDPSTETGLWNTNFGGNLKDHWAYSLPSNGERQLYIENDFYGQGERDLSKFNPFSVDNGVLSITARHFDDPVDQYAAWGHEYASGMLNTLGTFQQKYGYFEMKAELPTAVGSWPAFWMIPWPYQPQVEADIMEGLALTPNVDYRRAYTNEGVGFDNTLKIDPTGFHTYGMLWTPTTLSYYLDGVEVFHTAAPANWTDPMGLIVNLAVGGWGGEPDVPAFPTTLKVDYIKAYALADGSTVVQTGEPAAPAATIQANGGVQSGVTEQVVRFDDTGSDLQSAHIQVLDHTPTAGDSSLPAGRAYVIWSEGGAVWGAKSDNGVMGEKVALLAGSSSQFGQGTFLTDGKVVVSYMADGTSGGQSAWVAVIDTVKNNVARHELGTSSGGVELVPMANGGFAASWHTADGVRGVAYDAFAYDGKGWYGPERMLSGDLIGVTTGNDLIAHAGSGQQVYDVTGQNLGVTASISVGPEIWQPEGNTGVTTYTYTLTRDWDVTQKSTVAWRVAPYTGTTVDGADFDTGELPHGVATFDINQSSTTISFNVVGDTVVEPDEYFQIILSNPVNAKLGASTVSSVIVNDDGSGNTTPPANTTIDLTTTFVQLKELSHGGVTNFSFTVTRSGPTADPSTVKWQVTTSGADPAELDDFFNSVLPAGTLTFAAGETTKTVIVPVVADTAVEGDEMFSFTLYDAVGAVLRTAKGVGKIIDDDGTPAPPQLSLTTSSLTLAEGASGTTAFNYTITRTGDTSGTATVDWAVTGTGTAPADGADFVGGALPHGTVTFAAGQTTAQVAVNVAGDAVDEASETFTLTLSNAVGAGLGTASASGTITNDDGAGGYAGKVLNSSKWGDTLTGGTGNDTINAGQGPDQLTGGAGRDVFAFAQKPLDPSHIADFQVGTDKLDLSALLQQAGYTGADPVADKFIWLMDNGAGGTKILFDRDGAGTAQQWPDRIIELDGVSATGLTWTALTNPSATGGGSTAPVIAFSTTTLSLAEGNTGSTAFSYTVTRTGDTTAASTVNWAVTGSGTNPATAADFTGAALPTGTLTFAAGETTKTITVNVAGDTAAEQTEGFSLTLSGATGATLGSAATAAGVITNDDGAVTAPTVALSTTSLTLAEGNSGSTAFAYTVTRTGDTTAASTVNWAVTGSGTNPATAADFTGGALPTGTLSFAAGETSKVITVNVAGDTTAESNEGFTLTLSGATGATLGTATASGTITNDDTAAAPPTVALTTTSLSLAEGNSGSTAFAYTVTRTGDTTAASTVQWAVTGSGSNPASAADFAGGALPTGTLSFAAGETSKVITVNVAGDTTSESNEGFALTLSGATGATLGTTVTASGTITNDDTASSSGQVLTSSKWGDTLTGGTANDTLNGGQGPDVLTGGAGADVFAFAQKPLDPSHIKDFQVGVDKLDLSKVLQGAGYTGSDPVGDHIITLMDNGAGGTKVLFDRDGLANGQQWPDRILELDGVSASSVTWAQLTGSSSGGSTGGSTPPTVALSTTSLTLSEGNSGSTAFAYTVTRTGDTTAASTVQWAVTGSGTNPASATDFAGGALPTGTLSFAAGETSKVITVNVAGDTAAENNEGFTLTLSGATGATLGTAVTASGTITNDDTAGSGGTSGQVLTSSKWGDTLTGGTANDTLNGGQGPDVLTGGAGADVFAFAQKPLDPSHIKDFQVGVDRLDLSQVLSGAGYTGSDPVADHVITLMDNGAGGTKVLFDRDGLANGQQWPDRILELDGVSASSVTWAQLTGSSSGGSSGGSTGGGATAPTIALSTTSLTLAEGNTGSTAFAYTVTRTGDTTAASSVQWAVAGSGANPATAADFTGGALPTGTLSFAAGETSKVITVNVAGDTASESNEGFTLTLSGATGASLGAASATGTITNDDSAGAPTTTVALTTASLSLAEGNSGSTAFAYTVTRTGDTSGASSVSWSVAGSGTNAASASDFVGGALPSGTLSFAAGETSKVITLNVAGDTAVESTEGFTLTLSGATGATLGAATATGTITNDDVATASGKVLTSSKWGDTLTGGDGNDTLNGGQGPDQLTGGAGADLFVFAKKPLDPAHITDFQIGVDHIDLSGFLRSGGYAGSDPIGDHVITLMSSEYGGTKIIFDSDGAGTAQQWGDRILELDGVSAVTLSSTSGWLVY